MCRVDEVRLHGLGEVHQRVLYHRVVTHRQGGEEGFGQVHQRILQRPAAQRRPVFGQARLVQAVLGGKALQHHFKGCIQGRLGHCFVHLAPVMRAGEHDEGVGVEVLGAVQRVALGVDAVEPAAVLGVVKVALQGAQQGGGTFRGARLLDAAAEQVQLARAGHGTVALYRQGPVLRVEGFEWQGHVRVPARALPQRHDALGEVLLDAVEQGREFRLGGTKVGHGEASSRWAFVAHGSRNCGSA